MCLKIPDDCELQGGFYEFISASLRFSDITCVLTGTGVLTARFSRFKSEAGFHIFDKDSSDAVR